MFFNFNNRYILNMDNVVYIEAEEYSNNKARITIVTTAISHNYGGLMSPGYTTCFQEVFVIEDKQWFELLEALQQNKKVFTLLSNAANETPQSD